MCVNAMAPSRIMTGVELEKWLTEGGEATLQEAQRLIGGPHPVRPPDCEQLGACASQRYVVDV